MTLVEATVASIPIERPAAEEEHPQGMRMDKAYDSDPVRTFLAELGFTPHIRNHGEEAKDISENGIKARRWVVERTHSWLNWFRRLLIRWEKKMRTTSPYFTWLSPSSASARQGYSDTLNRQWARCRH